jgi:DNA-binding MarR family transcriptional regulator
MTKPDLPTEYLGKLGFTGEEAKLYLSLSIIGPSTLLEVSRETGIERTKLYRIVDDLRDKGLIEEIPRYKKRTIRAADLSTMELLVKEKELEDKYLSESFNTFSEAVRALGGPVPGSNVIYYKGKEGLRQMIWHILRGKDKYHRVFTNSFWNDILGDSFVLKLNEEMHRRNIKVRDLYSDEYIKFKQDWVNSGKDLPNENWDFWDSRYLPDSVAKINLNIDIYNDVVAYYYWQDDEIFGVEIINERVANLQKQVHDVLWKMAKKRPEINWTASGLV